MEARYHLGYAYIQKKLGLEAQSELEKARKLLEDKKNKGQPVDIKFEIHQNDALVKAKQLIDSSTQAPPTTTSENVK